MEFSANQIASLVDGTVEGNGDVMINAFSKIEEGKKGSISFLANPKYSHYIYSTESSAVLVRKDFVAEQPVKATLIRVEDPYATIARLLSMTSAVRHPVGIEQPCHISQGVELPEGTYVGAFACIGQGVRLGRDVKIYPQSYIGEDVTIGEGTVIYAGVKVYHGCRIGARCIIHSGAVIGADGFGFAPSDKGYQKIPQIGNVEIADDVEIGANTTIDRATMGSTRVKRGVKLDNLIQVAHNVEIGENTVMAAQTGIAGSTKIGDRCMIGGQAGFAGHIKVGDSVRVGAQSGIPSNVADNSSIIGYPATDAKDFARQSVYVKNLGKLNRRVDELEKSIKGKNKSNNIQ